MRDGRPHRGDLGAEQVLHRALDVDLVGAGRHVEDDRLAVLAQDRRLLRDERPPDHVCEVHDPSTSCRRSTAALVAMIRCARMTSRAFSAPALEAHRPRDVPHRAHAACPPASRRRPAPTAPRRSAPASRPPPWSSRPRANASTTTTAPDCSFDGQRLAQRPALLLARHRVLVAARLRAEHGAALAPQRAADLAGLRAARALLLVRLLARAADQTRGSSSRASRGASAALSRTTDCQIRSAFTRPPNTSSRSSSEPVFSFCALTMSSVMATSCPSSPSRPAASARAWPPRPCGSSRTIPGAPGTAPRTISRCCSPSTRSTNRFSVVTRSDAHVARGPHALDDARRDTTRRRSTRARGGTSTRASPRRRRSGAASRRPGTPGRGSCR